MNERLHRVTEASGTEASPDVTSGLSVVVRYYFQDSEPPNQMARPILLVHRGETQTRHKVTYGVVSMQELV